MTDANDPVTRVKHDGRVFRWERPVGSWPGHSSFVVLRGGEVVVGDRYARDGVVRSYACRPESLLEGCFADEIAAQLGADVLQEVLAEVRHDLGVTEEQLAAARKAKADAEARQQAAEEAKAKAKADAKAAADAKSKARAEAKAKAKAKPERSAAPAAAPDAARVSVSITACTSVNLSVATALRAATRASVSELLGRLEALPYVLQPNVPRAEAETLAQSLRAVGLTVELTAAS